MAGVQAGEEVVLTDKEKPVAKLVPLSPTHQRATPDMVQKRGETLSRLRRMNPFRSIEDPVAWQREIRRDRPLPSRG